MNETIELDHDVEEMEKALNLPWDILEALHRESKGSKPNIKETEVTNQSDEGATEKPVKIGVNFPKDMKAELIALLERIIGNLCLVLSRYAKIGYRDRCL